MNTFNDVYRVLKPTGSLFVNIDDTVIDGNMCGVPEALVLEMKKNGWVLNDRIIWYKSNPLYQVNNRTQPSMEFIYHFVKSTNFYYDKSWVEGATFLDKSLTLGDGKSIRLRNVFKFDGNMVTASTANTKYIQKKVAHTGLEVTHTATFPREIPLIGILSATKPGDVVLDCFNGLATTGEVALELGRNYIGFDLNDEYLAVSKERLDVTLQEITNTDNTNEIGLAA
jgi:DNA modification methylase